MYSSLTAFFYSSPKTQIKPHIPNSPTMSCKNDTQTCPLCSHSILSLCLTPSQGQLLSGLDSKWLIARCHVSIFSVYPGLISEPGRWRLLHKLLCKEWVNEQTPLFQSSVASVFTKRADSSKVLSEALRNVYQCNYTQENNQHFSKAKEKFTSYIQPAILWIPKGWSITRHVLNRINQPSVVQVSDWLPRKLLINKLGKPGKGAKKPALTAEKPAQFHQEFGQTLTSSRIVYKTISEMRIWYNLKLRCIL